MPTKKLPTGCVGLDDVLAGGIPSNCITVIMGAPGTGKTILAEQMAFANATPDTPALYLTTFSEPLEKFIAHGTNYKFFDPSKVGVSVFYEDLGVMLRDAGIAKLAEIVADLFIKHRPRMLVIDSFKALNELFIDPPQRRSTIYELATVLSSYQCTSFLVGEYSQSMMTELPEFAIADAVLHLMKYSESVRQQRFLRVEKLRGSDSIAGLHAFAINADGIELFPRLLTPKVAVNYVPERQRVNIGIPQLDQMTRGGFWRGSTTLLAGPPGSGKTIVGLNFIHEGVSRGEPGVFVGFQENPTQLMQIMRGLSWDVDQLFKDGFEIMYRSPVEMQLDSVANELFRRVRAGTVKRVVIDAVGDLERTSIDDQRFADFIYALTQWFAAENVTGLMTYELAELFDVHRITTNQISNMSDNLVVLIFKPGPETKRVIRIMKTRASEHDQKEHALRITAKGIMVDES